MESSTLPALLVSSIGAMMVGDGRILKKESIRVAEMIHWVGWRSFGGCKRVQTRPIQRARRRSVMNFCGAPTSVHIGADGHVHPEDIGRSQV